MQPCPTGKRVRRSSHLLYTSGLLLILSGSFFNSCGKKTDSATSQGTTSAERISVESGTLKTVRLLPYWVPTAQFGGYYVGIEKGIFKKHGLKLEILPFDSNIPNDQIIREKQTDFALLWLVNALEVRDKGADIVNIAQFSSRSSLMLVTKKNSGIARLEDMNGKRAGIWIGFERQPQALFNRYHLNVNIIPIGSTNNLFLQGGVDITNANWFDEYHSILNSGLSEEELNKFFFADYGLNFLEDGIYCLNETLEKDPATCKAFAEAAIESWEYVFSHQEEAVEIVVKYAKSMNQPVNRSHQEWMVKAYQALYIPDSTKGINTLLPPADFESIQDLMVDNGFISKKTPYTEFYKPVIH
jgi:NitT/TauT family transport system substrate-binding protein